MVFDYNKAVDLLDLIENRLTHKKESKKQNESNSLYHIYEGYCPLSVKVIEKTLSDKLWEDKGFKNYFQKF